MSKKIDTIILDSKDRISGSTTDFKIKPPVTYANCNALNLREVTIPIVMDNILTGYASVEINDVAFTVPQGLYSIDSLLAELNLIDADYIFTITNYKRIKVKYVPDDVTAFKFEPLLLNSTLGFTSALYNGANYYIAEELPNMVLTRYFTLHSSYISNKNRLPMKHSDQRSDLITYIPINVAPGEILVYEPLEPIHIFIDENNVSEIDFQLKDEWNNVVDLNSEEIVFNMDRLSIV